MTKQLSLTKKDIAKYALLPGVIPRIRAFAENGFGWLASLMAVIYATVGLLPPGHPYLNPANIGKFGIRHVIAEAANNLILKKENIDQIVIFFLLLLGFLILIMQVGILVFGFIMKPAFATGLAAYAGLFETRNPEQDIAMILLDRVFAVPGLFGSTDFNGSALTDGNIPNFNAAMHELFQYYNMTILIVGVFIFLYYIVIMVGETAQSGTPFGRRFNHIWAPLRLVAAVGLLVPINYGYNSAQYITLFAAKHGSGFATNAWILFNQSLNGTAGDNGIGNDPEQLLALPSDVRVDHLVAFMAVVATCRNAYEVQYTTGGTPDPAKTNVLPYIAKEGAAQMVFGTAYADALTFYDNKDVVVRYGVEHDSYTGEAGRVKPFCGEITVHTNDVEQSAALAVQEHYYRIITDNLFITMNPFGQRVVNMFLPKATGGKCTPGLGPGDAFCDPNNRPKLPGHEYKQHYVNLYNTMTNAIKLDAYNNYLGSIDTTIEQDIILRGWGGAGIWYNKIAQWNGSFFSAIVTIPTASRMPLIMQEVERQRKAADENVDSKRRFEPFLANGNPVEFNNNADLEIAKVLNQAYLYWMEAPAVAPSDQQVTGNIFHDTINAIFGVGGLFDMDDPENITVHPLAQLVGIGKGILDSTIQNLMTSLAFAFLGGMGEMMNPHLGSTLVHISQLFVSMASVGLTVGFLLYYVMPFLPFMYFFFAVGGWIKTVFEAMVGVPLWALAHLRVDGNGFPSDSASNGYFLIFEIFVRPILCVFGLLAGLAIFTALARTLNGVFDLVTVNLAGSDCTDCAAGGGASDHIMANKRNAIDELFFTVIYAILIYIIGTSSFKMIDQVPNGILRWMGAGVQSFGDQRDDPLGSLHQYAATGGYSITSNVIGLSQQGARTLGNIPGGLANALTGGRSASRLAGNLGNKGGPGMTGG